MKLLPERRPILIDEQETASQLIDTIPLIMRALRNEIRSNRPTEFSVPQFRVLAFLSHNEGAALSDLATHIGLMRPTMSKMVESLVRRGWVERETAAGDRRYVQLRLTENGRAVFNAAREKTRLRLAEMLKSLPPCDKAAIVQVMKLLQEVFASGPSAPSDHGD